jgi:UDP-N-acetylmuramoylalanine--D-glutamate ligase
VAGVDYFNDSKATNVDAALKALEAFDGGVWIILGGKDKGSDYRPLREPLGRKARAALLVGAAADKIAAQLSGAVALVDCGAVESAVRHASRQAHPGDVVLLAPACASFDQFDNFELAGGYSRRRWRHWKVPERRWRRERGNRGWTGCCSQRWCAWCPPG